MSDPRIIVALDFAQAEPAMALVQQLDPTLCRIKVGKELFTATGPTLVEKFVSQGFSVFLDLKFHDIPNTVANACKVAAALGVWMINVHALGGAKMMSAARDALVGLRNPPKLVAVTILTSMDAMGLQQVGISESPAQAVVRLASLAHLNGLDGVVCSAQEAMLLRQHIGGEFLLVTPGIRLDGNSQDDQERIVTPREALMRGADYLVIGRPITRAKDPLVALEQIYEQIKVYGEKV